MMTQRHASHMAPSQSPPDAMRLFVAAPIPRALAVQVATDTQRRLSDFAHCITAIPADAIHLTLRFIGKTAAGRIDSITRVLTRVGATCGQIATHLTNFGAFPRPTRPRILWVGLQDKAGKIAALATAVQTALEPLDIPSASNSAFVPHITVARLRKNRSPQEQTAVGNAWTRGAPSAAAAELLIDRIVLFQSIFVARRVNYEAMSTVYLS